jgi:hypothetical protein
MGGAAGIITITTITITKVGMRLGAHCPFLADLEIEQELIGVILLAEASERRPFQAFLQRRPEIASNTNSPLFTGVCPRRTVTLT